ncbi:putative tRNA-ribosyltransferase [Giardia duodenalis]|uniref:tRNA-ribosyltransferase n=1 Tax=Giardia intestinalis (strain ATCC 50803 / WB clone C6) TaxID=184922 RepID=A8BQ65_GIAIC|nr:putative tRNA-ribosyltransferase [Giardia intestinalis]KAE8304117.1 putative tRNA-ribosyltransferase [Giardia intestinalis]|eukprot:XP_001705594.1 tRNA-ribosyltransferase, putative [Giardia lamblia ATCC 50803]
MSGDNEITFSGSSAAIKRGLRELDRAIQTPYNRLQSILHDRGIVLKELDKVGLGTTPVFGNARTGCWYAPDPDQSVLFKSTDGHYGTWDFSLRKLNLQFLLGLQTSKAAVIVDATKAGKRYPDAIKRTIPIWCLVWSTVLSGSNPSELDLNEFFLPSITLNERDLILQRAERHASSLKELMGFILGLDNRSGLDSLFPIHSIHCRYWYVGQNGLCSEHSKHTPYERDGVPSACTIHLVSISKETPYPVQVFDEKEAPFYYIQGAADDAESWLPLALTPSVFVANSSFLCSSEFASLTTNEYKTAISRAILIVPAQEVLAYIKCPEQRRVIITNSADIMNKEPLAVCISLCRPNQSLPNNLSNVISIPVCRNLKYTTNLSRVLGSIHATFQELRSNGTVIFYSGQDCQVALAAFIFSMASENLVPRIAKNEQGQVELIAIPSSELHLVDEGPKQRIFLMNLWESSLSLIVKAFFLQKNLRQAIHSFTCVRNKNDDISKPET